MGRICSFYYLKHQTMGLFATTLKPEMDFKQVCLVMLAGSKATMFPQCSVMSLGSAGCVNKLNVLLKAKRVSQVCACCAALQ